MKYPDGEGPVVDIEAAKARAQKEHGKPEHKYRPGIDGHDMRDKSADADLDDPGKQEKDE